MTDNLSDNELIAKFMGGYQPKPDKKIWSFINNIPFCEAIHTHDGEYLFYPEELNFDKQWDWLMPVVEKIAEVRRNYKIRYLDDGALYQFNKVLNMAITVKQDFAYKAVVDFIKWYNETKPV